ncbi:YheT family hydrolase [Oceanibaculum pacificum]|nr:alpha/beta fold hydrolase [Oceanibaculum pacificum]
MASVRHRPPVPAFPPFCPRPPWWSGDLQTIRNILTGYNPDLAAFPHELLRLPMEDGTGDHLQGALHRPAGERGRPLAVLIHGLTGSQDSSYVCASALALLRAGYPVLRLSLRGAGALQSVCRQRYHAGRSVDLRRALGWLAPAALANGLVLAGYSLGGNMLLKLLGEGRGEGIGDLPVLAAASVSAPIDLAETSRRFRAPRNFLYHRWLLNRMKQEALNAPGLSETERQAILGSRDVYEYDDRFIAPGNGFAGAEDYYARCSALGFLATIRVPTLAIHAADDPWIPAAMYRGFDWADNPALTLLLASGGGHVGFHDREPVAWHDRCLLAFFAGFRISG